MISAVARQLCYSFNKSLRSSENSRIYSVLSGNNAKINFLRTVSPLCTKAGDKKINYAALGIEAEATGDLSKAIQLFTRAIEHETNPVRCNIIRQVRADVYRNNKQYDEAFNDLLPLLEDENCRFPVATYRLLSFTWQDCDNDFQAIRFLERGIKDLPEDLSLHYDVGKLYLRNANSMQARSHFEIVSKICDEDSYLKSDDNLMKLIKYLREAILPKIETASAEELCWFYSGLTQAEKKFPSSSL